MGTSRRITSFNLPAGRVIGGKYRILAKLGGGWEGEVYKVVEIRTGATRAAKLFFPHRNEGDKAVTIYARKLERLRRCRIVIQYHHSESIRHQKHQITCLISEFVEGELLGRFVERQPRKRLHHFEALHLMYALAKGLEEIHAAREYHGDLHDGNVMVKRVGINFDIKLVDFYHWGRPTAAHYRDDVIFLMRLLYDALGGAKAYPAQPPQIKGLILGLRRDLIGRAFPTARHLRQHLESFEWEK